MAKANITQYSSTPSSNTDINNINIDENCPASGLNNAIRELMAHLKNVDTGSQALTALSVTGNLLVGTTNTNPAAVSNSVGISALASGKIEASRDGNSALAVNRKTTDGIIASFHKDASLVGSIGIQSSGFYIDGEANHAGVRFSGDQIAPRLNGSDNDGDIFLGGASNRFKDLYLSGGVYLGGTGSANYLDDYEEGTFTPTLEDTGGGLNANLTAQIGQYTKIGNLCHIQIRINGDSRTATNNQVYVGGLPFTPSLSNTSNRAEFEVNGINLNLDAGFYSIVGQILHGDTDFNLLMQGTSLDNFRGHDLGSTYEIYVHGAYFTA